MEYYAGIKRNEILPFAMMWMELEGVMLSEISQSEKDMYHMTSLIRGILNLRKQTEGQWSGRWGGRDGVAG